MSPTLEVSPNPRDRPAAVPSNGPARNIPAPQRKYTSRKGPVSSSSSKALVMTSTRSSGAMIPVSKRIAPLSSSSSSSSFLAASGPRSLLRSSSSSLSRSATATNSNSDSKSGPGTGTGTSADDSIFDIPSSEDEERSAPRKITTLRSVVKPPSSSASALKTLKPASTRLASRTADAAAAAAAAASPPPPPPPPSNPFPCPKKPSSSRQPLARSNQTPPSPPPPPPSSSSPKRKADQPPGPRIINKRIRSHHHGLTSSLSPPRLNSTRSAPSNLQSWLNPPSLEPLADSSNESASAAKEAPPPSPPSEKTLSDDEPSLTTLPKPTNPRKRQILSRLLSHSETIAFSPPLQKSHTDVSLNSDFSGPIAAAPPLARSSTDLPRRRRLVDTLKAASFNTGNESDEDSFHTAALATLAQSQSVPLMVRSESSTVPFSDPHQQPQLHPHVSQSTQIRRFGRVSSNVGGAKITYGEVRSLLPEEPQTFEQQIDSMLSGLAGKSKDESVDEGLSSPDDTHGAIRSAHELRAAGDKTRFVDDMELLLADLEISSSVPVPATNGRRRNVMCELARKCADKQFVERMGTFSFEQRVFALAAKESDPLALLAWCVAVGFILHWTSTRLVAVSVWETLFEPGRGVHSTVMATLLDMASDINLVCKDRKMNMSRAAISEYVKFKEFVLTSEVWFNFSPEKLDTVSPEASKHGPSQKLSPQDVCLKFTDLLVQRLRSAGVMDMPILSFGIVKRVISLGARAVPAALAAPHSADVSAGTIHSDPATHASTQLKKSQREQTQRQLELVLSILESESLSGVSLERASCMSVVEILSPVLDASLRSSLSSDGAIPADLLRLHTLALRLTLNLTNNNPDACAIFASPRVSLLNSVYLSLVSIFCRASAVLDNQLRTSIDENGSPGDDKQRERSFTQAHEKDDPLVQTVAGLTDVLILSLGAAINLVEYSVESQAASLQPLSPACQSVYSSFFSHETVKSPAFQTASQPPLPSPPPSLLHCLLTIFFQAQSLFASTPVAVLQAETQKPTSVVSQLQVAHGYLAVLLGNLCLLPEVLMYVTRHAEAFAIVPLSSSNHPDPPTRAASALAPAPEGPSLSPIRILATTIREFVVYHRAVDDAVSKPERGGSTSNTTDTATVSTAATDSRNGGIPNPFLNFENPSLSSTAPLASPPHSLLPLQQDPSYGDSVLNVPSRALNALSSLPEDRTSASAPAAAAAYWDGWTRRLLTVVERLEEAGAGAGTGTKAGFVDSI